MQKGKVRRWSPEEDNLLKDHASTNTISELMVIIPGRSSMQIRYRCERLNITPLANYKSWTVQELQIALNNPVKIASKLLGRSKDSIQSRRNYAKKQGLNIL